jgi:fructose/tagatose bisphosphate aldolase
LNENSVSYDSVFKFTHETCVDCKRILTKGLKGQEGKTKDLLNRIISELQKQIYPILTIKGDSINEAVELRKLAESGISKINFSDELSLCAVESANKVLFEEGDYRRKLTFLNKAIKEGYIGRISELIAALKSYNRW